MRLYGQCALKERCIHMNIKMYHIDLHVPKTVSILYKYFTGLFAKL